MFQHLSDKLGLTVKSNRAATGAAILLSCFVLFPTASRADDAQSGFREYQEAFDRSGCRVPTGKELSDLEVHRATLALSERPGKELSIAFEQMNLEEFVTDLESRSPEALVVPVDGSKPGTSRHCRSLESLPPDLLPKYSKRVGIAPTVSAPLLLVSTLAIYGATGSCTDRQYKEFCQPLIGISTGMVVWLVGDIIYRSRSGKAAAKKVVAHVQKTQPILVQQYLDAARAKSDACAVPPNINPTSRSDLDQAQKKCADAISWTKAENSEHLSIGFMPQHFGEISELNALSTVVLGEVEKSISDVDHYHEAIELFAQCQSAKVNSDYELVSQETNDKGYNTSAASAMKVCERASTAIQGVRDGGVDGLVTALPSDTDKEIREKLSSLGEADRRAGSAATREIQKLERQARALIQQAVEYQRELDRKVQWKRQHCEVYCSCPLTGSASWFQFTGVNLSSALLETTNGCPTKGCGQLSDAWDMVQIQCK